MYKVYIRPILESGCEVWSTSEFYLIDKIEKVQRYFTRRMLYYRQLTYSETKLVEPRIPRGKKVNS